MKETLFIDMDGVLADFHSGIKYFSQEIITKYKDDPDEIPNYFSKLEPIEGAIEAFNELDKKFEPYILSTASWNNPSAWSDKLNWIKKHLGDVARKKLILSHHKNLLIGAYLIDDRHDKNGADKFTGELIHFGKDGNYNDWAAVLEYLM